MKYKGNYKDTLIRFYIHHNSLKVVENYMDEIRNEFFNTTFPMFKFNITITKSLSDLWSAREVSNDNAFDVIQRELVDPGRRFRLQIKRAIESNRDVK